MPTRLSAMLAASARLPASEEPTLDAVIARHIAARGGYERLKAVQTMRISRPYGTFGGNLPVVITQEASALLRVERTLPNGRTLVHGVNPTATWDTAPDGKMTERPPQTATEAREIDADLERVGERSTAVAWRIVRAPLSR